MKGPAKGRKKERYPYSLTRYKRRKQYKSLLGWKMGKR
jgi:hypothetical protein